MPRRRKDSADEKAPEGGQKPRTRRRPKLGNPDADPVRIHRDYVEQRLGGGGQATPEAYEEALRQWQDIPGAVSRPPAEVPRPPERSEGRKERKDGDGEDQANGSSP